MRKVIIVDDNSIARNGMKNVIEWERYGLEIAAYCENGQAAWDYIQNNTVDLIISDVEMPCLNGIDLLRKLRDSDNQVNYIFMSCYDDFEFVKSALDMNAVGYVLKPIVEDELKQAIFKVLNICEAKENEEKSKRALMNIVQQSRDALRERFFRELLFGAAMSDKEIEESKEILQIRCPIPYFIQVICIKILDKSEDNLSYDIDNMGVTVSICNMIKELCNDKLFAQSIMAGSDRIISVFITDRECSPKLMDVYVNIKEFCLSELNIHTAFGISNITETFQDVGLMLQQAEKATETSLLSYGDKFILYSDIESEDEEFNISTDLKCLQNEINKIIGIRDINMVNAFLDKYYDVRHKRMAKYYIRYISYTIMNIIDISLASFNIDFDKIVGRREMWLKLAEFDKIINIKQCIFNIFKSIFETIDSAKDIKSDIVKKVKEIVEKEYMGHITVGKIANELFYSTTHINNFFKQEMGITIFDYIVKFRMEKAQEMLKDPDSKIYAVAKAVGYHNQAHFKLLFKQSAGMLPNEYKMMFDKK